jgi:EARP and GARP complex-interacting protein 1
VLEGHDHWVTSVRYNPFHDQLVSSSGTDGSVGLWRVSSVSSAPIMALSETTNPSVLPDARVEVFRNHDESVRGMDWSACDAWCVASAGWGGTVVVDHVGSEEKYRILL